MKLERRVIEVEAYSKQLEEKLREERAGNNERLASLERQMVEILRKQGS